MATKRLPPRLLALSPGNLTSAQEPDFLRSLGSAMGAGLPGILMREPGLSDRDYLGLLKQIPIGDGQFWLGVHDRAHLAQELQADGLHLGFRSLPVLQAQTHFGARLAIGLSTHAGEDASAWSAADYLFHGPIFATPSKPEGSPGRRQAIGIDGLKEALASSEKPIWALGGLGPEHVQACLRAGAAGLAVLSGILGSEDPAQATRLYLNAL